MSRAQKRQTYSSFKVKRSRFSSIKFKILAGLMALVLFASAILLALLPAFI